MRHSTLVFVVLMGCTVENTFVDPCEVVDNYIVCDTEVTNDEAWNICASHESTLIDFMVDENTVELDEFQDSMLLGAMTFEGMWWVAGLEQECLIQLDQVVDNRPCDEYHTFICELDE